MRRYYHLDEFVKSVLLSPLFLASLATPRRRRVAFGSSQHAYNGNAKYLMLHMLDACPDIEVAWIAPSRRMRGELRAQGVPAYWKYEPAGLWYCLTAKVYAFNGRTSEVNHWTSGGATTLCLWHGVGLKAVGFASTTQEYRHQFDAGSLYHRAAMPWLYVRPDFFLSSSRMMTPHHCKAFRVTPEQCLELGYPRSDHFFLPPDQLQASLERTENESTLDFVRSLEKYEKVFLYTPTYRDTGEDFVASSGVDFERLDAAMREMDSLFIFKLHPRTNIQMPEEGRYPNLCFPPPDTDVYPYLQSTDVLITDYSSVYYDFLLLEKGIVLFLFDRERYVAENRNLILDLDTHMPGRQAMTFDALLEILTSGERLHTPEQARMRTLFWDDYRGNAAAAVAAKIREMLDA